MAGLEVALRAGLQRMETTAVKKQAKIKTLIFIQLSLIIPHKKRLVKGVLMPFLRL